MYGNLNPDIILFLIQFIYKIKIRYIGYMHSSIHNDHYPLVSFLNKLVYIYKLN
jgi:hypothetical protein